MKKTSTLSLLMLLVASSTASAASTSRIQKSFEFNVQIEDTSFSHQYEILGKNGSALQNGTLSIDSEMNLRTINPVDFTVWETTPSGDTTTQINSYELMFKNLAASYLKIIPETSTSMAINEIDSSLIGVKVNGMIVELDKNYEISNSVGGFSKVELFSKSPLPEVTDKENNVIRANVVAMFVAKV